MKTVHVGDWIANDHTNQRLLVVSIGDRYLYLEDADGEPDSLYMTGFQQGDWYVVKSAVKQVGGSHYTDLAIQPLEVIRANKMGFLDGSALKYIMRFRGKNGVEDLKKAIHFCELLIEELENGER